MLFLGIVIISAAAAILLFIFDLISGIGMIVAFCICFAVMLVLWALTCVIFSAFVDKSKPCMKHSRIFRFYANCIIDSVVQLMRIRLHVTGLEKLPEEKFLLVGNHKSSMDPILEMGVLRRYNVGFVAKKQLFAMPIIGKIMHKCHCVSLDRENPRKNVKTILNVIDIIKSGEASIGIYPEGRRNNGAGLLPFKPGAFKIAQKAGCPVVVAVIRNSELVKKNAPFRKTDVYVDFINVIGQTQVSGSTIEQMSAMVYNDMRNFLNHENDHAITSKSCNDNNRYL